MAAAKPKTPVKDKMHAKTGTAVSTKIKSNIALPADYDDQLAADVAAFKGRLAVAESNTIQVTQDKHFKLPGADGDAEKVDTVAGIIVDFCAHKAWYETDFDRDNPVPPNCFAVGFIPHDNLTPSDNSPECQSESGNCKGCPRNKFEKTAAGKWLPKDCKDTYVLALVAPDDDGTGKMMRLKLSSTALKAFDKYVKAVSASAPGRTLYNVVTEFSFDPNSDYPSIRCELINDVPKSAMGLIMSLREEAANLVSAEPDVSEFEEKVVAARETKSKGRGKSLPAPARRRTA